MKIEIKIFFEKESENLDADKLSMLWDFGDIIENPEENMRITVVDHNGKFSHFSPPSRH